MALERRSVILLGIALLAALLAAWAVRGWMEVQKPVARQEAAAPVVPGVDVLVAAENLPAGLIVKAENLRWQQWPEKGVDRKNFVTREGGKDGAKIEDYVGSVTRSALVAGEPVTAGRLVKAGDRGFLAAVLTPGMRAVTLSINATQGLAGLVFPGDRVDLIVTHTVTLPDDEGSHQASETVLANIRILAIDTRTETIDGKPQRGSTATLEVTPKQAEEVAIAQRLGTFSLSLRGLATTENVADANAPVVPVRGTTHTWDTEVSRLMGGVGGIDGSQKVVVMRGASVSSQNFQKVGQ
jgi:pilus assembly protein CpaB